MWLKQRQQRLAISAAGQLQEAVEPTRSRVQPFSQSEASVAERQRTGVGAQPAGAVVSAGRGRPLRQPVQLQVRPAVAAQLPAGDVDVIGVGPQRPALIGTGVTHLGPGCVQLLIHNNN